jgi:anti-anti-sigma regulatory factor
MAKKKSRKNVLTLEGDLTIMRAAELHSRFLDTIEGAEVLTIDAGDASACDISFVQLIASAAKTAEKNGGKVVVKPSDAVVRVAEEAGVSHLIPFEE